MMRNALRAIITATFLFSCSLRTARADAVHGMTRNADGITVSVDNGTLRLQVWSDQIIRVTFAHAAELPADHSLSVISNPVKTDWTLVEKPDAVEIVTAAVHARVDRATGAVEFLDTAGRPILSESKDHAREFEPAAHHSGTTVSQAFVLQPDEGIFGLGQHPDGRWNYRGTSVHLEQKNTDVAIPVLVSDHGYGIFWDNPAITDVDAGVPGKPDVLRWRSEAGDAVDYYFMDGPEIDSVIGDYRVLTGPVPM
jgi:alpha-D-xyloside xylohydrolase